jgi:hypothetical protein
MKYVASIIIACGLLMNVILMSCKKNTDCKANIFVTNQNGSAESNVPVLLYATVKTSNGSTVTADLKASGNTDGSGKVSFTFKLPAIYDILATKTVVTTTVVNGNTVTTTQTLTGTGIIKLEEGKSVDKTVVLK